MFTITGRPNTFILLLSFHVLSSHLTWLIVSMWYSSSPLIRVLPLLLRQPSFLLSWFIYPPSHWPVLPKLLPIFSSYSYLLLLEDPFSSQLQILSLC